LAGHFRQVRFVDVVVVIAFFITGALAGLFGGLLGLGGGAVVVPALIFVFSSLGMSSDWVSHQAVGTSLVTVIGTGLAATLAHHRRGAVRWGLVLALVPGILAGAGLGSILAGLLPELWLRRVFGLFLLYTGLRMLLAGSGAAPADAPLPGRLVSALVGLGIGTLSALVGIGGGTLTVPFLVRHGVPMRGAVATSSACGVPIAVAGSLGFVISGWGRDGLPAGSIGFVYWPAAVLVLVASMPLAPVGARLAHRLPVKVLKRVFGIVLLLVSLRLLLR
jgi:uncharacterized protein